KIVRAEEEPLNRLMKEKAASNADLLAFRQQISQLRGHIESAEGRLNVLSKLAALSTVYLSMYEDQTYTPPPSPHSPTFTAEVKGTWESSLDALGRFAKAVALVAVAAAPWLPLLAAAGGLLWWQVRRRRRNAAAAGPRGGANGALFVPPSPLHGHLNGFWKGSLWLVGN